MRRASRLEAVAVLLVLAVSLALRLASLDAFVASDELKWTCRSLGFREALMQGDWAGTFRVGHPGVITTWLGTLALPQSATAVETCLRTEDASLPTRAGETPQEQTQRLAELGRLLFQRRVGVALFTWLSIVAIYLLARLLWGRGVALLGLVLVALDPFYLAHSRFLHLDAVLASAMTLSLLSLLISVRSPVSNVQSQRKQGNKYTRKQGFLVLSGALGGLAMLNKSPGMFLVPFVALLLAANVLRRGVSRQALLRAARDLAVWVLVAGVVYVALWPAMWVDPVGTVQGVLAKAIGYAEGGHESGNFFLGRPVDDPGPGFYPLATLFRLSPLTLIGLIAALPRLVKGKDCPDSAADEITPPGVKNRPGTVIYAVPFDLAVLLLYSVLFGAFMTLGAKKFDRYLLPVFPALDLVGAVGLFEVVKVLSAQVDKYTRKQGTRDQGSGTRPLSLVPYPLSLIPCFPFSLFPYLLVSLSTCFILPHHPYYLTTYNPLLGGPRQAQKVLLVGWGEGYDRAAAYLNGKPEAQHLQATVRGVSNFSPLFSGDSRPVAGYRAWQSDYVVFYISQVQRRRNESLLEEYVFDPQAQPEHVVTLHGVDYAWLYPNTHYVQPMSYIEERDQPGQDLLLVNGDSLFAKYYQGDLPLQKLYTHWGLQETGELLDSLPSDRQRVWYARYPDADPKVALDLLESRGVLLEKETFPTMEVILYRLVGPETARQPLDLRFGNLRLVRYGLTDPALAWGQDGGVVLEWEALRPLGEDYTAFLHLRDSQGHLIAQGDKLITDESLRPTSQWGSGTPRLDLCRLPIPPGTPPGRYDLEVGVYLLATGERLPLLGPDGEPQGTAARLEVEIGVPRQSPAVADLGIPHLLEQDLTPQLRLLGYGLDREAVRAGQALPLHLFWQALGAMEGDVRLRLELRDTEGTIWERSESSLAGADHPTTRWQAGELIHGRYDVVVDEAAPTGEMSLQLNLLDEGGRPLLPQPLAIAEIWGQSARPSFVVPETIGHRYEINLGDEVTFLGYDLDSAQVKPGESLRLTLYWQARREMEKSYKVFVHLYDEQERIWGQRDRLPGQGAHPTTEWQAGEVVADRVSVPVDPDAPAGAYQLAVGLYDGGTGERLVAFGQDGERLPQDRIVLGQVDVVP